MWKLYCLPGRVIAEFGYLFPGRGQIWASQRRRESGFAAFLFATGFWIVFWLFIGPMIAGAIENAVNSSHPASTATMAARDAGAAGVVSPSAGVVTHRGQPPANEAPAQSVEPAPAPSRPVIAPNITAAKTQVVFAAPHEVVEALPSDNGQ